MAALSPVQVAIGGTQIIKTPADVAGDTFLPGNVYLVVATGATACTVGVVVPGNTKYGLAAPDISRAIPINDEYEFGPFPDDLADSATGMVNITYSAITAVNRALKRC